MIESILKYKETTIGKVPVDWEVKKISDGTNYIDYRGKTPQKTDKGILLLTARNIKFGFIDYDTSSEYISSEDYSTVMSRGLPKIGDVLFTTEAPMGNVAQIDRVDIALAQRVIKFRAKSEIITNDYLKYYLLSDRFQKLLNEKSTGGTAKGIKGSTLHKMELIVPPIPEQQKIAEILSTWEKAIQETGTIIKSLEKRNRALAFSLFQKQNWNSKQLKELFVRITEKNIENNKSVTTISAKRGFIKQEDFFNKTVASEVLTNYYLINKGDFCYNKSYSKGYDWGVVKRLNNFEKAVVTTLYICFRLIAKKQNSDFWELYFSSGILDRGLSKIAHEGGRAHGLLNVTSGDFFSLKVAVPSLEEQNKIAEILTTANKELHQYRQKLDNLKTQKKGLMQQLLTGKVRTM